jgi:pyridoxal phosphate enzyme (YggS family)
MTEDHACAARKGGDARQQCVAHALIGHQPEPGQLGIDEAMALVHHRPYSAAMTTDAKDRLASVHAAMAKASKIAGRAPEDTTLIAISKTKTAEDIRPLIAAGQRVFGENRVQEAEAKWPALLDETPGIELHLVGQLQSNKAEEAVALFDVIHSVDRPSLVTALVKAQGKLHKRPRCFVQVNIGDEDQKGGCAVADLQALLAAAAPLEVVGLMAIPPADIEAAPFFALLAKLARDHGLSQLSMGMSGDFETAIMLGATYVRIGTALFGERD